MRDLLQDARFATRQWRKNKTFTVIAVTTLALAVRANTAIFSVVETVRLLPVDELSGGNRKLPVSTQEIPSQDYE